MQRWLGLSCRVGCAALVLGGCNGLSIGGLGGDVDEDVRGTDEPPNASAGSPSPGDDSPSTSGGDSTGLDVDSGAAGSAGTLGSAGTAGPDDGGPGSATTLPPPPPSLTDSGDGPFTSFTSGDDADDDPTGDPQPQVGFADCVSGIGQAACEADEVCFVDDAKVPTAGACLVTACTDGSECPLPPPGSGAAVACADVTGDAAGECILPCDADSPCPQDMVCFAEQLCLWPEHGFSACMEDPTVCLPSETCLVFDAPPWSFCSQTACDGDASVCPGVPPGGSAVATCDIDWDTDGSADCTLSCSEGQGCPSGMSCQGGSLCAWTAGVDLACANFDLGTQTGNVVAFGTTVGAGDQFTSACNGAEATDVAYSWTAPATGIYTFDTFGSDFDTVLSLYDQCDGDEFACNDDAIDVQSELTVFLDSADVVVVVVDGYGETGNYVLNIN